MWARESSVVQLAHCRLAVPQQRTGLTHPFAGAVVRAVLHIARRSETDIQQVVRRRRSGHHLVPRRPVDTCSCLEHHRGAPLAGAHHGQFVATHVHVIEVDLGCGRYPPDCTHRRGCGKACHRIRLHTGCSVYPLYPARRRQRHSSRQKNEQGACQTFHSHGFGPFRSLLSACRRVAHGVLPSAERRSPCKWRVAVCCLVRYMAVIWRQRGLSQYWNVRRGFLVMPSDGLRQRVQYAQSRTQAVRLPITQSGGIRCRPEHIHGVACLRAGGLPAQCSRHAVLLLVCTCSIWVGRRPLVQISSIPNI